MWCCCADGGGGEDLAAFGTAEEEGEEEGETGRRAGRGVVGGGVPGWKPKWKQDGGGVGSGGGLGRARSGGGLAGATRPGTSSGPSCGRRGRVGERGERGGNSGLILAVAVAGTPPDDDAAEPAPVVPDEGARPGLLLLLTEELLLRGTACGRVGVVSHRTLELAARSSWDRILLDVGANTGCCGKATSFFPMYGGARDDWDESRVGTGVRNRRSLSRRGGGVNGVVLEDEDCGGVINGVCKLLVVCESARI